MATKKYASIQGLIEEQAHRWQLLGRERQRKKMPPLPVVYLSRETGAHGDQVAERLAEIAGYDLFDRALIRKIAESASMAESVVETLDEKNRSALIDWVSSLGESKHFWFDEYLEHLSKVIGTIGRHGRAIIVGRGAGYLLGQDGCQCLRVRIIASLDTRVQRVMDSLKLTMKEAKKHIQKTEAEQRAFLKRYFDANIDDPCNYDLVVNTDRLSVDEAAQAVYGALQEMIEREQKG